MLLFLVQLTTYQGKCGYDIIMRLLGKKRVGSVPYDSTYQLYVSHLKEQFPYGKNSRETAWLVEAQGSLCRW